MPYTATQKSNSITAQPPSGAGAAGVNYTVVPITGAATGLRRCEVRVGYDVTADDVAGLVVGMHNCAVIHVFARNSTAAPSTADTIGTFSANYNDLVGPIVAKTGYTYVRTFTYPLDPHVKARGNNTDLRLSTAVQANFNLDHLPAANRQSAVCVLVPWSIAAINYSTVGVS